MIAACRRGILGRLRPASWHPWPGALGLSVLRRRHPKISVLCLDPIVLAGPIPTPRTCDHLLVAFRWSCGRRCVRGAARGTPRFRRPGRGRSAWPFMRGPCMCRYRCPHSDRRRRWSVVACDARSAADRTSLCADRARPTAVVAPASIDSAGARVSPRRTVFTLLAVRSDSGGSVQVRLGKSHHERVLPGGFRHFALTVRSGSPDD